MQHVNQGMCRSTDSSISQKLKLGQFLEHRSPTQLTWQCYKGAWTLSDGHTGMTLGEIAAQAATSGECELNQIRF